MSGISRFASKSRDVTCVRESYITGRDQSESRLNVRHTSGWRPNLGQPANWTVDLSR
jgi:hypothetical protein